LDDLINYLYAGSINAALIDLAQDTGATAKVAREEAARLKIQPFLTKGQTAVLRTISDAREKIILNLSSAASAATRKETETRLRTALQKFGFAEADVKAADVSRLIEMLQDKLDVATETANGELMTQIQTELNTVLKGLG
jgi:hypothetical protein